MDGTLDILGTLGDGMMTGAVCGLDGVCTVPGQDDQVDAAGTAAEAADTAPSAGLDAFLGTREVASAAAMEDLGREMGRALHAGDLVVLTGALGAGKTTLTRGIGDGLGVRGPIQSPTFVIARTHPSLVGGAPLVHADAYRLRSALELDDLDIDVDGSVVVVEWGAGKAEGLRDHWWEVEISREVGGTGAGGDSACALPGDDAEDQDHPDPRLVTVSRRS